MSDQVEFHFDGIEEVTASTDGEYLVASTTGAGGNRYFIRSKSDEVTGLVAKLLLASVQAEINKNPAHNQTKAISIYKIKVMAANDPDQIALAVSFQSGTPPLALCMPKARLVTLAQDILLRYAPQSLADPRPFVGRQPN